MESYKSAKGIPMHACQPKIHFALSPGKFYSTTFSNLLFCDSHTILAILYLIGHLRTGDLHLPSATRRNTVGWLFILASIRHCQLVDYPQFYAQPFAQQLASSSIYSESSRLARSAIGLGYRHCHLIAFSLWH